MNLARKPLPRPIKATLRRPRRSRPCEALAAGPPAADDRASSLLCPHKSDLNPMKKKWCLLAVILVASYARAAGLAPFRPPAVPLVACDPYFSIWSQADNLTDANTTRWTGRALRLTSMIRIDGKPFRLMGNAVASAPPLPQTNLEVLPTRTIYSFAGQGITASLTFMTPALPDDLDLLSRPVTYLIWSAQSTDGKSHDVSVYFD